MLKYAQKSVTSQDFTKTFETFIKDQHQNKYLAQLHWNQWIYSPGKFPIDFDFSTEQTQMTQNLAEAYTQLDGRSPNNYEQLENFTQPAKLIFLDKLRDDWG